MPKHTKVDLIWIAGLRSALLIDNLFNASESHRIAIVNVSINESNL